MTRTVGAPMPNGEQTEVRVIETNACDDLAAVAAACAAFDRLMKNKVAANVGLLFTVAEEVGFIGAIHAAKTKFIPRDSRLICLKIPAVSRTILQSALARSCVSAIE